jgi:hypothetical protein
VEREAPVDRQVRTGAIASPPVEYCCCPGGPAQGEAVCWVRASQVTWLWPLSPFPFPIAFFLLLGCPVPETGRVQDERGASRLAPIWEDGESPGSLHPGWLGDQGVGDLSEQLPSGRDAVLGGRAVITIVQEHRFGGDSGELLKSHHSDLTTSTENSSHTGPQAMSWELKDGMEGKGQHCNYGQQLQSVMAIRGGW